jgi:hypothetical protein
MMAVALMCPPSAPVFSDKDSKIMETPTTEKLRIKFRVSRAGYDFAYQPGDIVELPAEQAQRLIAAAEADLIGDSPEEFLRVRILESRASVTGGLMAKQIVRLPRVEALRLIEAGEAESVEPIAQKGAASAAF